MKKFTKKCFCKKDSMKFRCDDKLFDENIISFLYCPLCVDRALPDSLIIDISGIEGRNGVWGINYNSLVLKEKDHENFNDSEKYYSELFSSGKCVFDIIPKKSPGEVCNVIGLKKMIELEGSEYLGGQDKMMVKGDGEPTELPKKTRSGPEESYIPFSGYKGHH